MVDVTRRIWHRPSAGDQLGKSFEDQLVSIFARGLGLLGF